MNAADEQRLRHYLRSWDNRAIIECFQVEFFLAQAWRELGEEEFIRIALEEGVPPKELK